MRGVVPLGSGRVEVRDVPDPRPGPGEAVVALRNAGICGSDLHTVHKNWEEIGERQNLVIGHEASGVVAEVGSGVERALVGRRVSVYHYRGCGLCRHCLAGEIVYCAAKRGYGWHLHGADADYLLTDARNCCPLPDALSHLDGSFLACAAGTAYAALRKLEAVPGAPVCAVVGLGPVGLTAALLARALGWQVIGLDRVAARRGYAERLGVAAVAVADDDLAPEAAAPAPGAGVEREAARRLNERVRAAAGGRAPGRVFDASGSEAGLAAALALVARGGRVVTVGRGMWPLRFAPLINVADLIRKQAQVMGSWVLPIHYYHDLVELMVTTGTSFALLSAAAFPITEAAPAFAAAAAPTTLGKVSFTWPD